ncbi:hypothetical protein PoB_005483600 [Plakobranchus ocellatus]|uniref:MADF domain-containing protein n=1 Tax=Plakobranchus ocellatus TaxID=259542 RepID=A0AAV4BYW8_9GAST|nr:hypothetical protein PoB_005483600 [Plakobranchus ocellatus]
MVSWPRKITERFIELYRAEESLWNAKSKHYYNLLENEKAYQNLVDFVRTFEPDANKDTVKNEINYLNGSFQRELEQMETSGQFGCVYEPKLWCFSNLSFLDQQSTPSASLGFSQVRDPSDSNQNLNNDENDIFQPQSANRQNGCSSQVDASPMEAESYLSEEESAPMESIFKPLESTLRLLQTRKRKAEKDSQIEFDKFQASARKKLYEAPSSWTKM